MNRLEARNKAETLVAQMTVEEAASQLKFDASAIERLNIPAYNWWGEGLHGVARAGTATGFPQAIAMAACFDPCMMEKVADVIAMEARAKYNAACRYGDRDIYKGLTLWSPNINIFRDPRWGRGHETYGEDPVLTSELGCAFVCGLQGDGDTLKTAACAKHYAVHSGPEELRHEFDAKATPKDLYETYLPAFKALVQKAGVEAVMGAYNRTNGEPCCGSKKLLKDLLRDEWKFQGHVVSDCWAVRDFHSRHKVTGCPEESVALALNNGCDLNCGCTYQYVLSAYEKGLISEETIRRSAVRLFTTRYLLGMMEGSEYDSIGLETVECKEHLELSRLAAERSCVLLKNNGILPLQKEKLRTLGVIGPNANSRAALIGNYHGTSSRYTTVLEGLQDALQDDVRILYSEGCDISLDRVEHLAQPGDRISEAKAVAAASDAVILVLGLNENLEGEEGDEGNIYVSGDKSDLLLPESQRNLMKAVLASGKPTIIVLLAGSSIDLQEGFQKADGILLGWYPGPVGGKAIADILLGKVSPSGKLPVTFYHNEDLDRMPGFEDYAMKGRTYRYIDFEPAFPFGFGLTYGDCAVTGASAEVQYENVVVKAKIINKGIRATEDVLQVYAQNLGSVNAPKNPRLVGFQRVVCPVGENLEAEMTLPAERLKVVDETGASVSEGTVRLYVSMGQPDALTESITGHKAVEIELFHS